MPITRSVTFDDPMEIARDVRTLPGIEFLRRLIASGQRVPIATMLGFRLVEVDEGVAVFEAEAGPWAYNPIGSVQGGWYASVLDGSLGVALHTLLPAGIAYSTVEFKVNLVKAVRPDTGVLRCVGRVLHKGRSTAVTEARMTSADGTLHASATSTQFIFAP